MKKHTLGFSEKKEIWTEVITAKSNLLDLKLGELWQYRDLIKVFVRRDFVAQFKQTVLGPAWMIISPVIGAFINATIFNNIANISTNGAPPILFQMLSLAVWSYFISCFNGAKSVFTANANVFSKVYFPRLTVPVSSSISALLGLFIRFFLIIAFCIYFYFKDGTLFFQNIQIIYLPFLLLILAVLGISMGIFAASITLKYKDVENFITYGVQFLLYTSAVVYPISVLPENFYFLADYNPLVPIFEACRNIVLGVGEFNLSKIIYSALVTLCVCFPALMVFNYTERTFVDKV